MHPRCVKLGLVLAALVLAYLLRRPRCECELDIRVGHRAARVRSIQLVISDSRDRVVRDVEWYFPEGALPEEVRSVRLPAGELQVGTRVTFVEGPPRATSHVLEVEGDGAYRVDLAQ